VQANQRSRTAEWIAAIRAGHLRHDRSVVFEDPFAIHLTSRGWRWVVNNRFLYWLIVRKMVPGSARGTFLARARYTEEKLESAVLRGIDQYVILGAGLDSFAWRRRDLARKLSIFELDHPASQLAKRRRLEELGYPVPENLELIAVDLGRETVAEALARSRYRRDGRAFFSLLGTVQYVPREGVMNTLRSMASTAAPGSELVLSYIVPRDLVERARQRGFDRLLRFAARRGEPFISFFDPAAFPPEVCALGYELLENRPLSELARRYSGEGTDDVQASYIAHLRITG